MINEEMKPTSCGREKRRDREREGGKGKRGGEWRESGKEGRREGDRNRINILTRNTCTIHIMPCTV